MKRILLFLLTTVVLGACTSDDAVDDATKVKRIVACYDVFAGKNDNDTTRAFTNIRYNAKGDITHLEVTKGYLEYSLERDRRVIATMDMNYDTTQGKIYIKGEYYYPEIKASSYNTAQTAMTRYSKDTLDVKNHRIETAVSERQYTNRADRYYAKQYYTYEYSADNRLTGYRVKTYSMDSMKPETKVLENDMMYMFVWENSNIVEVKTKNMATTAPEYSVATYRYSATKCFTPFLNAYTSAFNAELYFLVAQGYYGVLPVDAISEYCDYSTGGEMIPVTYVMEGDNISKLIIGTNSQWEHQFSFTWQ